VLYECIAIVIAIAIVIVIVIGGGWDTIWYSACLQCRAVTGENINDTHLCDEVGVVKCEVLR
jgi:hypothetical protein